MTLELPALPVGAAWHLVADTHASPPQDISELGLERPLEDQHTFVVRERSVVTLVVHTAE